MAPLLGAGGTTPTMDLQYLLRIGMPVRGLAQAGSPAKPGRGVSETDRPGSATKAAPATAQVSHGADAPASGKVAAVGSPQAGSQGGATPAGNAARTKLVYMEGTYVFEHSAQLLDIWADGEKVCVELDETIFHAQGGGQPSDVGVIEAAGLPTLKVAFVAHDKARDGAVRHDCTGDFATWKEALGRGPVAVTCKVDEAARRSFARLHSAGHLLDVAVATLGFRWQAGKGYHFPDGPYVEYSTTVEGRQLDLKDQKAKDAAVEELNAKVRELIEARLPVEVDRSSGVRVVTMNGTGCPCGGTHVEHTGEIGGVTVKKLQAKQGNLRVSYTIS